jgi:hypothetical protein
LIGEVVKISSSKVSVFTKDLGQVDLFMANVVSIVRYDPELEIIDLGERKMVGVNHYLIAPSTPYGLEKGQFNLQNSEIFLVSAWYGIAENFSLGGGFSLVPGITLAEQVFAIVPKFHIEVAPKVNLSAQYAYIFQPDGGISLLSFSAGFGRVDNHISIGYTTPLSDDLEESLVNIGGVFRTGNKFAMLLDINIPAGEAELAVFGVGGRFIGVTSSFDFGFLMASEGEGGVPFPWFNYTIRL